jgi:hypothetical protein
MSMGVLSDERGLTHAAEALYRLRLGDGGGLPVRVEERPSSAAGASARGRQNTRCVPERR